jgi:hypothetical protein
MLRCTGIVTLAAVLMGCGNGADGRNDGGPVLLTVGVGATDFESIPDSGVVEVIKGPQGGIHIIVNARAAEMDQPGNPDDPGDVGNPITRYEAFDLAGAPAHWVDQQGVPLPPYHLGWYPGPDGGLEIGGHILRLHIPDGFTPDSYLDVLEGRGLRIRVTVEEVDGRTGTGEAVVITHRAMQ